MPRYRAVIEFQADDDQAARFVAKDAAHKALGAVVKVQGQKSFFQDLEDVDGAGKETVPALPPLKVKLYPTASGVVG